MVEVKFRCVRIIPAASALLFSRERAKFFSRSHDPVIRVNDEVGNVIETHEHTGDFKEP